MKRTILRVLLLLTITIVIMYFLLKDNFLSVFNILIGIDKKYIILLILVILIGDLFKSISISTIARRKIPNYKYKNGFSLILKTNFFNGITPFSLGGQPFQLYSLKKNENINYIDSIDILFEDFYTYQLAFVIISIIFVIINSIFDIVTLNLIAKNLLIIGLFINIAIGLFLIFIPYIKKYAIIEFIVKFLTKIGIVKDKEKALDKILNNINNFKLQVKKVRKDYLIIIKCIVLNILKLFSIGIALWLAINAVEVDINILFCLICYIFILDMSSFIPIPGASGGVEYIFTLLLGLMMQNSVLLSALILWRFMTYYLPIIFGGIIFVIEDGRKL